MTEIRGLLLDFYGTLVHEDDEVIPPICEQVRRGVPAGPRPSVDEIGARWWKHLRAGFDASYGDTFVDQRTLGLQSLTETAASLGSTCDVGAVIQSQFAHWVAPPMFPDTRRLLDGVRQMDIPICIVSNIDRCDIEAAIALHDMRFDHLVTSEDVRAYKPRPELFRAALARMGLRSDEVLHVGDSRSSDVLGAWSLDIPVAWLNRGGKPASGQPVADYTVRNLDEVLAIVRASVAT